MKQKPQIILLGLLIATGAVLFIKPSWLTPYLPSAVTNLYAGGNSQAYRPPDPNGWNGLHAAANMKNLAMAKQYLEFGEDVNAISTYVEQGTTPLHEAAFSGNADIVKLYLDHGAKVDILNKNGESALHLASTAEVVRLLIAAGADPKRVSEWGTPLHSATRWKRPKVIKALLEQGAKINIFGKSGEAPLHYASTAEVARLLIAAGDDPTRPANGTAGTPLHSVARGGYIEVAKVLLEHGAQVNAGRKNDSTPPVLSAIINRRKGMVVLLVENGAPLTFENGKDNLLHSAAFSNQLEIVKYLHKKGLKLDSPRTDGQTALHQTTYNGSYEVAHWLVTQGADVNARDNSKDTPLHKAAVDYMGKLNKSPNDKILKLIELLWKEGAELEAQNNFDNTPLHIAANVGSLHVAKLLLKLGANPQAKNRGKQTPLDIAKHHKHPKIVDLFQQQ